MKLSWDSKDPNEVLDYDLDWSDRLSGDIIVSSQWLVDGDGLVIDSNNDNGTVSKVWLSGGTLGQTYTLTNRIETDGGRTMDQSVRLKIISR